MSPAQFWKLHLTGLHLGLNVCHRTCNMMLGLTVKLRRLPELIISKWLSTALPPYPLIPGWILMFCKMKTPNLNSMVNHKQHPAWCEIYTAKELVPALASLLQIANLNKVSSFLATFALRWWRRAWCWRNGWYAHYAHYATFTVARLEQSTLHFAQYHTAIYSQPYCRSVFAT